MLIFFQFPIGTRAVVTSSRHRPFCFHDFVFLLNCLLVLYRSIGTGRRSAGTHYSWSPGFALAACPTPCRVHAGDVHVQGAERLGTGVSDGWLSSCHLSVIPIASWDQPTTLYAPPQELERFFGDADTLFAVAGPRVWNPLPASIRTVDLQETAKDTFCLIETAALSNWLFLGAGYKYSY